jgi:hypothetical protein
VVVTVSVQLSAGEIPSGRAAKRRAAAAESGSVAFVHEVVALLERERTCPSAAIAPWKCGLLLLPAVGVGIRSGIVTATESTEPVSWKAGPAARGGVVGAIDTVYRTVLPSGREFAEESPESDTAPVEWSS